MQTIAKGLPIKRVGTVRKYPPTSPDISERDRKGRVSGGCFFLGAIMGYVIPYTTSFLQATRSPGSRARKLFREYHHAHDMG